MAETNKTSGAQAPAALTDAERAELEELRALKAAQAAPAPTEDMDETIPGGIYVSGKDENGNPLYVNAEGQPIDSKGNVKE